MTHHTVTVFAAIAAALAWAPAGTAQGCPLNRIVPAGGLANPGHIRFGSAGFGLVAVGGLAGVLPKGPSEGFRINADADDDDDDDGRHAFLVDNFNDRNFDGWSKVDFSEGQPWGPGTYDASSRALRIRSGAPVPIDDLAAGAMNATFEPSRANPRFGNGILRGTVRANTEGTTAGYLLRASTFPDADHDYGFFGSSGFGTFYIERFDLEAGGQTILAMGDPARHPFVAGKTYVIEAGVWGKRIWMRAWEVGKRRPVLPLLTVRDDTLGPEEGTLLCVLAFFDPAAVAEPVQVDATFDDITFTPLPPRDRDD